MKIDYVATADVQAAIAALGRTEDLRLSPSNRCLAIAAFRRQKIALFDIHIDTSGAAPRVELSNARILASPHLRAPHGLDFIDDEHLLVANRDGQLCLFKLPADSQAAIAEPVSIRPQDLRLDSPGSLSVRRLDQSLCDVLVCNNFTHVVTRHRLDYQAASVENSSTVLGKWLDVPDGIDAGHSQQWLAVSNHNMQSVLLYDNRRALHPQIEPAGILTALHYPHGLRITRDDRHILVADAGAPYVHIFRSGERGWQGVHTPHHSLRVLDDDTFRREQKNPQEGGPKGIDLDRQERVLAVTCSGAPLAFFDLGGALGSFRSQPETQLCTPEDDPQAAVQVQFELWRQQQIMLARKHAAQTEKRAAEATAWINAMRGSRSWQLTAPLRWVSGCLQRKRPQPEAE